MSTCWGGPLPPPPGGHQEARVSTKRAALCRYTQWCKERRWSAEAHKYIDALGPRGGPRVAASGGPAPQHL